MAVYNSTTKKMNFYNGSSWQSFTSTASFPAPSTPLFTAATTSGYTASASTENAGTLFAWYAFNQNIGTPGWASAASCYNASGVAIAGSLGGITGSWVKIQFDVFRTVSSMNFTVNISTEEPKRWYVLYSADDITWNTAYSTYSATDFTSYSPGTGVSSTGVLSFASPVICKYIAIVITKNGNAGNTALREIYYA